MWTGGVWIFRYPIGTALQVTIGLTSLLTILLNAALIRLGTRWLSTG